MNNKLVFPNTHGSSRRLVLIKLIFFFLLLFILLKCEKKTFSYGNKFNQSLVEEYDYYASKVGIQPLNYYNVADNNLLIRVWMVTRENELRGYFLHRIYDKWSGYTLVWEYYEPKLKTLNPKGDATWDQIGKQLLRNDILSLPDTFSFPRIDTDELQEVNKTRVYFGGSGGMIFGEVLTTKGYRTYYYSLGAGYRMFDFTDYEVVEAFSSAEGIRKILLQNLESEDKKN
jgi:hypothetical protein